MSNISTYKQSYHLFDDSQFFIQTTTTSYKISKSDILTRVLTDLSPNPTPILNRLNSHFKCYAEGVTNVPAEFAGNWYLNIYDTTNIITINKLTTNFRKYTFYVTYKTTSNTFFGFSKFTLMYYNDVLSVSDNLKSYSVNTLIFGNRARVSVFNLPFNSNSSFQLSLVLREISTSTDFIYRLEFDWDADIEFLPELTVRVRLEEELLN